MTAAVEVDQQRQGTVGGAGRVIDAGADLARCAGDLAVLDLGDLFHRSVGSDCREALSHQLDRNAAEVGQVAARHGVEDGLGLRVEGHGALLVAGPAFRPWVGLAV